MQASGLARSGAPVVMECPNFAFSAHSRVVLVSGLLFITASRYPRWAFIPPPSHSAKKTGAKCAPAIAPPRRRFAH